MSKTVANGADAERRRLREDGGRLANWKRWGPYLPERQWGTVREDYSAAGTAWDHFPFDHAASRAYRWGEDGLLGWTDRECRLCFGIALWNEIDPILKERLFGLANEEGNHGEDVKELYYYLDATPTHSYNRALYKYPQRAFPYEELRRENRRRGRGEPEFELADTGIFAESRYFDVSVEYAKASPDDILIRLSIHNRGPAAASLRVLPQLWFRNTWIWGCEHEGCTLKPRLWLEDGKVRASHESLGEWVFEADAAADSAPPIWLFTENESNSRSLWGVDNYTPYVKDAFHRHVVEGEATAVNPAMAGTKAAADFSLKIAADSAAVLRLRLRPFESAKARGGPFGKGFDAVFRNRIAESDAFHAANQAPGMTADERLVHRQACAGLLWSKQFYHLSQRDWLRGDPQIADPPPGRSRNREWTHLFNRDILSMPDKWEYPWYAAWDLAFHMIPFAHLDADFAKNQLLLLTREWYMHPDGRLPAYEWEFSDVNPPVHAWACWRVYKMTGPDGGRDTSFLERAFHKLLLNFTWWVNRKDRHGRHLFGGGFLGMDNIGVFDRSKPLPGGGHLEQADGTAWMAFYCTTMLAMAIELALHNPAYEDVASKFFEHFIAIADAINHIGGGGLWDEEDGFYHDVLNIGERRVPLKIHSLVGLVPLFAVEAIHPEVLERLPGFAKRMRWFLEHRRDLAGQVDLMTADGDKHHLLLAIPCQTRLRRVLTRLLDEDEFLAPYGIRSLSLRHRDQPFIFDILGQTHTVAYQPGDSDTPLFGGNSNWRGPVWFPMNYLLIEALERYHHFYGDNFTINCPTKGGPRLNLRQVADFVAERLIGIFTPGPDGRRPCHGDAAASYCGDAKCRDLVLFHEFFNPETGRGCGASHQTGWTALVAKLIEKEAIRRDDASRSRP